MQTHDNNQPGHYSPAISAPQLDIGINSEK